MKSTRLKESSSPFSLLRFEDTNSILSCTASLLPTLPLRAHLQARSSSLLHLPLSLALLARWARPPPFLNVRIKVWQKSSRVVLTAFAPPRCRPAVHASQVPGLRAGPTAFRRRALREPGRPRRPAARRERLPAPGRARCHGSGRGRRHDPPRALSAAASRPGRAAESMCIQLTPRRAVAGCRGPVPDVSVWV